MKKSLHIIVSAALVAVFGVANSSCSKNEAHSPKIADRRIVVDALMPSDDSQTKVSFTPGGNSSDPWVVAWSNADVLGGFQWGATAPSANNAFTQFQMTALTDAKRASFGGTISADNTHLRFLYPFRSGSAAVVDGKTTIDVGIQSVDMSVLKSNGYEGLRRNATLIGDILTVGEGANTSADVQLSHVNTYIRVNLKFTNFPTGAKLHEIELSSSTLCRSVQIDLTKDIADASFMSNATVGAISVSLLNSPNIVNGAVYTIPIAALPVEFASLQDISLTVCYCATDGQRYRKAFTITNNTGAAITFSRGTHNYLNFACDMSDAVNESTDNWVTWAYDNVNSFASGDGTAASPYLISTPGQLGRLANLVNAGDSQVQQGVYFALTNDISLNGKKWVPIGNYSSGKYFRGTFDGRGYTISGLYYCQAKGYAGLFGRTAYSSKVMNVRVEGSITATENTADGTNVGGISGYHEGLIINCSFAGSVQSYSNTGGIVGYGAGFNGGRVINCYNEGTVHSRGTQNQTAGGVFSYGSGQTINCYNIGTVTNTNGSKLAIGVNPSNCYYLAGCGDTQSGATSMTDAQMRADDFVVTLNANVESLRTTYPDIRRWKSYIYPTFAEITP